MRVFDGVGNSVDLKKDQNEIFRELQPVQEEMSTLKLLRPQYDAVAFETVGVDLARPEA